MFINRTILKIFIKSVRSDTLCAYYFYVPIYSFVFSLSLSIVSLGFRDG